MGTSEKISLPWSSKMSYGVGHVFNDLCASMWFTYLLIFYEKVLLFDPTVAGLVLLVGQIADGISTPIVGILADKENKIPMCAKYGRRKVWHLLGTVLIFFSFPFIFNKCLGCEEADIWTQFGYYCFFVIVFQFGWACVQISHLALIPDLANKKHQRTELNSIRYAFTVLSNLSVFTITFFVLNVSEDDTTNNIDGGVDGINFTTTMLPIMTSTDISDPNTPTDTIGPEDDLKFRNIALICCGIGAIFTFIFHLGVSEPPYVPHLKPQDVVVEEKSPNGPITHHTHQRMKKIDWFKEIPFYQIAVLYMATRLYVNLYQVYIPLYVQETLHLSQSYIATVPFAMYLAGFTGSLIMKQVNKKIGRKGTFGLGCIVGLGGCIWVGFGSPDQEWYTEWGIFLVAALLGIGGSTLLITCLSITADLIGNNVEGGAFVYGFMSLVDKFSNGIIIMIIQDSNPDEAWYYRSVITFACGASCLLGLAVILTLIGVKVGHRQGHHKSPVLEMLEESETTDGDDSSNDGIDNPALSTDEKPQIQNSRQTSHSIASEGGTGHRNACQMRAEDTPTMCKLSGLIPNSENENPVPTQNSRQNPVPTQNSRQNPVPTQNSRQKSHSIASDGGQKSICQMKAEDTPTMCKLSGLVPNGEKTENEKTPSQISRQKSHSIASDGGQKSICQMKAEDTPTMCKLSGLIPNNENEHEKF